MKKKLTIKTLASLLSSLRVPPCTSVVKFFFLFILFSLLSCEQPFKAGLGPVIDLQAPVISLTSPGAGAYIRGTTVFTGRASDDYKIDSLWFQISNYPDTELPKSEYTTFKEIKKKDHKYGRFYKITDITGDSRSCTWKFSIDTTMFDDGDFLIKLMAIDSVTKEAITDDIAFYVKNNIPQISMAFPSIVPGTNPGQLGGDHLNYNYIKDRPVTYPRILDSKGLMSGMISDNQGINRKTGEAEIIDEFGISKTVELFPPQIRFWRVNVSGEEDAGAYPPGVLPPLDKVKWEKLPLMEIGVNNVQFTYQLPAASGVYFGFEIRAQSSDRVYSTANYPRSWNPDTADKNENAYVLIYVREPLEYPTLELYKLEDIFGPNGWDPSQGKEGGYKNINGQDKDGNYHYYANPVTDLDIEGNYPFIDKPIATRNGAFTLRIKAYHSGGISTAKVYWEKGGKKGRFIWDPANDAPFNGWIGDKIQGAFDYSKWGRSDPYVDNGATTRSFVFTYSDQNSETDTAATADRIPNTVDFYPAMRGRSKIQVYNKDAPQSGEGGRLLDFDELPEADVDGNSYWDDIYKLEEGSYNLSVYTSSSSGTRIAMPLTLTISIDRKPPEIKLNYIEGSADGYKSSLDGAIVVNGVIQPRFILSDSLSTDSGFRTATLTDPTKDPTNDTSNYFYINGRVRSEQAYILVSDGQKSALETYLGKKPWPDFKSIAAVPGSGNSYKLGGVTISKHGPIFDSVCKFKTSKNYDPAGSEPDALDDGIYWLYAFARDNAFNVGTISFPIDVKLSSDDPVFNFKVGSVEEDVTQPDWTFDRPNDAKGSSFKVAGRTRNIFNENSNIRVEISDDDSLDLGLNAGPTSAVNSKIQVKFIGSTTLNGETVAYDDPKYIAAHPSDTKTYLRPLSDNDIKAAFAPQTWNTVAIERNPVKKLLGTINQSVLLAELKKGTDYNDLFGIVPADNSAAQQTKKAAFNSLPDGIYRVDISICDYSPAKLIIEPADSANPARGPDSPKVKTKSVQFWIAVDGKNPRAEFIDVGDEASKPANSYISASDPVNLKGKVEDENGPITVTWRIYNEKIDVGTAENKTTRPPVAGDPMMTVPATLPNPDTTNPSLWKYEFNFPINMNNNTGTFNFELKFKDRFDRTITLSRRYSVDNEPPKITLTKQIETFDRSNTDYFSNPAVTLPDGGAVTPENKKRLAVKTVSFSFNPEDNFKVSGVRWWLLPAGETLDNYDFYPATVSTLSGIGTYYSASGPGAALPTFKGAYGVVNVEDRLFTIAVDSTKMKVKDGEYNLWIMAIDAAGNKSTPKIFQTVFFLQDQDRPYIQSNITPSIAAGQTQVVGETGLVVRGTVWENNGFGNDFFWPKIVQVWFKNDKSIADPENLATLVDGNSNSIPGYEGPADISSGLTRQGRNINLSIGLKDAFTSAQIGGDGKKSYIIKVTDSPVNKLKEDTDPVANPAGVAAGYVSGTEIQGTDETLRVSRWQQYDFIYDGVPPEVKINTPDQGKTFGKVSFTNDFNLSGYIQDVNLANMNYYYQNLSSSHPNYKPGNYDAKGNYIGPNDTRYYFEYYLEGATVREVFPLDSKYITSTQPDTPTAGVTRVNFKVLAADVAKPRNIAIGATAGIIPQTIFDDLEERSHYLTLVAKDLSGKENSAMYNFIKDTSPPLISFMNIDNDNDKSKVDDNWWSLTPAVRHSRLIERNANGTLKLPLSTIYYEPNSNQRPVLSGTFADDVSDIAVTFGTDNENSAYAPPSSTFRYWIDRDKPTMYPAVNDSTAKTRAFIDGAGRNVRWEIYLTKDGTKNGTPLADGVHTIVIEIADTAGVNNPDGSAKFPDYKVIAFRIDSKPPEATIAAPTDKDGKPIANTVFGDATKQGDPVFILNGTAKDANLKDVWIRIRDKTTKSIVNGTDTDNGKPIDGKLIPIDATSSTVYTPLHTSPPAAPAWETSSTTPLTPDVITLNWKYSVTNTLFSTFTDGRSYEVIVVARDQFGNESEQYLWTFTYDKGEPVITFPSNTSTNNKTANNTPANDNLKPKDFIELTPANNPTLAEKNGINRLKSESLRIQGEVTDSSSAIKKLQSQVWKYNWDVGPEGRWDIIETWTDVPGLDLANNNLLKVSWTKNFLGQDKETNPGLTRYFNLGDQRTWKPEVAIANPAVISPEGLYRLQLRAKDASYTQSGTNKPDDPNYNDPTKWNTNTDIGNPAESYYVYFYYDRTDPELTGVSNLSNFYSTARLGGKFSFAGTVTDNNRVARLQVATGLVGFTTAKNTATFNLEAAANNPAYPSLNYQPVTRNWNVEIPVDSSYTDGRYSVIVTVYDMTGRSYSVRKDFTLDNTPPWARFTLPAKEAASRYTGNGIDSDGSGFASVVVNGGETSVITGETGDKPGTGAQSGSESGIDQMWFHLGFLDGNGSAAPVAPTRTTLKTWEDTIITQYAKTVKTVVDTDGTITYGPANSAWNDLNNLTVKQRNTYMDLVSDYRATGAAGEPGNAWFKLGGQSKPLGFTVNPNIYDWRMEIPNKLGIIPSTDPDYSDYNKTIVNGHNIVDNGKTGVDKAGAVIGGLKLYGGNIWVKGREYRVFDGKPVNQGGTPDTYARQMARAVASASAGGLNGIYRLPLWIRLVDKVGNVQYYCHDIFFYPDGDIPSTSLPDDMNGPENKARGGAISVDGTARDRSAVYDVVFRVFADAERGTDLDGKTAAPVRPAASSVVRMPSLLFEKYVRTDDLEYAIIKKNATDAGDTYVDTTNLNNAGQYNTNWYRANLMMKPGEPIIPWNFMLNSMGELTALIADNGFNGGAASGRGTKPYDKIRVWVEVYVFNGETDPIRSSIYANDGKNTAGGNLYSVSSTSPRPYVKCFYLQTTAPKITHPNVSVGAQPWPSTDITKWLPENTNTDDYGYKGAGTQIRKGQFALKAILDPDPGKNGTSSLKEVVIRTKLDSGNYTTWSDPPIWSGTPNASGDINFNKSNGISIVRRTTAQETGLPQPHGFRYDFIYAIDTTAAANSTDFAMINNGNWKNTGGTVTVQVRIKDNANPPNEAQTTIEVDVDNFAPVAAFSSDGKELERTNSKVAGTNVDFIGRAYDWATSAAAGIPAYPPAAPMSKNALRKINKVTAWFLKNGQYVNMTDGSVRAHNNTSDTTLNNVWVGRKAKVTPENSDKVDSIEMTALGSNQGTASSVKYPSLGGKTGWEADWVRVISETNAGIPGRGMLWSPVNSSDADIRWMFTLDSTKLPDGALTLCYIVEDVAGNASYYEQDISVRNKYPVIDSVTLYTDNNGQGAQYTQEDTIEYYLNDYRSKMFNNLAATDDEIAKTGYLNTGFISKNRYIGFKVETRLGNGDLNFRLQHVTRKRIPLTRANLSNMVKARNNTSNINLYTIAKHGDYSPQNWKALGVPIEGSATPPIGTHFVLQRTVDPADPAVVADPTSPDYYPVTSTAEVWQYTLVGGVRRPDVNGVARQPDGTVVLGGQGVTSFEFKETSPTGTTYFDPDNKATKIGEYDGSHPEGSGDVKPDDPNNTAFFLIRVWDSVNPPANTNEATINDQLYAAVVVGMNVYLRDTTNPTIRLYDLNPYTEIAVTGNNIGADNQAATIKNAATAAAVGSNIIRGGLFNTNTERDLVRSGYIDPHNGSFALTPKNSAGLPDINDNPLKKPGDQVATGGDTLDKVSGKVILRGLAQDDQLVDEIWIQIGGNAAKKILNLDTATGSATRGKMIAASGAIVGGQARAFATETLHWKTGHTVEWAYVWDTETDPSSRTGGGPITNVTLQVYAKDRNGGRYSNTNSPNGTANAPNDGKYITADNNTTVFHNQISVDIVPYIIGFEREKPKFTTKRSLQGWYSFYQSEANIALLGYNFGQGSNVVVNLNSSGSGTGTDITATYKTAATSPTPPQNAINRFSFAMPNTAASGKLDVKVGTVNAYNHTSVHATKSWNKEYNSYTPGSDLWVNKPHAHIWRTLDQDSAPRTYIGTKGTGTNDTSIGLEHPGMALEYTGTNAGRLHGTWAVYGNAIPYYGTNNNTVGNLVNQTTEPYLTPDISIFNGGSNPNFGYSYQGDGTASLYVKSLASNAAGNTIQASTTGNTTQRWKNVRISKAADNNAANETNVGRIYMTANDAQNKSLWYGMRNNTTNNAFFIDGGNATDGVTGLPKVANAGEFSAVDYDSTGPIIAYYDQTNDTVRVALGSNNPNAANQFSRNYLLPSGNALYRGSGKYISIKVDKNNGIHLSFFNSVNNTVVYYYAAGRANISQNGTAPNGTTVKCHAIDNVVTGGNWSDISVDDNGNPWIVYGDNSRTGNYDGVRVAYLSPVVSGSGAAAVRFFSGSLNTSVETGSVNITGWEAVTMPANYVVNNDRLNIEAWPPTARAAYGTFNTSIGGPAPWNAAIGYPGGVTSSQYMYRVGYFYYPAWKGYTQ